MAVGRDSRCCRPLSALFSRWRCNNASMSSAACPGIIATPANMLPDTISLPCQLIGTTSPNPTVVKVVKPKYSASKYELMFGFTRCSAVYMRPVATERSVNIDKDTRASCSCQPFMSVLGIPKARSNRANVAWSVSTRCSRRIRSNRRLISVDEDVSQEGRYGVTNDGAILTRNGRNTTMTSTKTRGCAK